MLVMLNCGQRGGSSTRQKRFCFADPSERRGKTHLCLNARLIPAGAFGSTSKTLPKPLAQAGYSCCSTSLSVVSLMDQIRGLFKAELPIAAFSKGRQLAEITTFPGTSRGALHQQPLRLGADMKLGSLQFPGFRPIFCLHPVHPHAKRKREIRNLCEGSCNT